jgi:hypothetical protein
MQYKKLQTFYNTTVQLYVVGDIATQNESLTPPTADL